MKNSGRLNRILRLCALICGIVVLIFSIYWSQDGFNFDFAGDAGYSKMAVVGAYALAITVSVIQFVFSTNFRELNPSLLVFGILAYVYSIATNKMGIIHFQGSQPNEWAAWFLGFCVDGIPEPLIAWALGESLSGDFVGNIGKTLGRLVNSIMDGPAPAKQEPKHESRHEPFRQEDDTRPRMNAPHSKKGSERRRFLEESQRNNDKNNKPNRFDMFGE